MAEHNELGSWEKKWRSNFFERRIYYFGDQLDFQKQKLISFKKENTLAVVEVKTLLLLSFSTRFCENQIQLLLKAVNAYVNEKSWMLKSVLTS
jgi:hypothetical protein